MPTDFIVLVANVALTLSVIVALVFNTTNVRMANRDRRERLTLDTLRKFDTREFAQLVQFVNNNAFPTDYERFRAWGKDEQTNFVQLMQHMESLGIMLEGKVIDISLVDKTLGAIVVFAWNKYKPILSDMRENHNDPYIAEHFQWIAERLERNPIKQSRKPVYKTP
jgi:hypothetical protein